MLPTKVSNKDETDVDYDGPVFLAATTEKEEDKKNRSSRYPFSLPSLNHTFRLLRKDSTKRVVRGRPSR